MPVPNNGDKRKIILVDDKIVNLTAGRTALSKDYSVFTVPSGEKLLEIIPKVMPDLVLLDIEMPGMSGFDVIKVLKADPTTAGIPVIFLTGRDDTGSELEGLSLGAIDYISKPFSPPLLLKRIEVHLLVEDQKRALKNYNDNLEDMVEKKTKTIVDMQNSIVETMAELVECRDDETGSHIVRTKQYLEILIDKMMEENLFCQEVSAWNIEMLILSSQLHDIGKIAISDVILRKPSRLTDEEFEEMKKHTVFGGEAIDKIQLRSPDQEFLDYAKVLAFYHHEKWDGTGYPSGLKGNDIPLAARLMSIVDVYDALTSKRPYKDAFSHEEAVNIITEGKGTQFDPTLVDLFLRVSDKFKAIRSLSPE